MMRMARLGVVGFLVGASLALMGVGTASAAASDCTQYLHDVGYGVGPIVSGACQSGAAGKTLGCIIPLVNAGVLREHADFACHLARL